MTEHIDFESSPDAYQVKLDAFEGPLDLLLHLIRTNEVNIYDIPISLITEQYLGYIALMQDLNLDVAGEFLVMASTLIHVKSRTLLPRPEPDQLEGGPEEDPREALVRRLLEHQKYKAAAGLLHDRETLRGAQFMRPDARVADAAGDDYEPELEVDLFSLLAAFKGVLERASRRPRLVLPPEQIWIEDRLQFSGGAVFSFAPPPPFPPLFIIHDVPPDRRSSAVRRRDARACTRESDLPAPTGTRESASTESSPGLRGMSRS